MSVETTDSVPGGEPHISVSIFCDAGYGLLRQSVFNAVAGNNMLWLPENRRTEPKMSMSIDRYNFILYLLIF